MTKSLPLAAAAIALTMSARRGAGQAQGRRHRDAVRAARRARPAASQRFQSRGQDLGGKLGGREVEVIVEDDELKPDVAVTKVKALVERDKVDFVVGPIFSNILQAIMKPATEGGAIPDQPECRHVELRRQGMQPELLRHLLPERPGLRRARASMRRIAASRRCS